MKNFVMPAKTGIHVRHLARGLAWIPAFAGMTMLTACAHKAELKTPSQIEAAQKKKDAKAAKQSNHSPLTTHH